MSFELFLGRGAVSGAMEELFVGRRHLGARGTPGRLQGGAAGLPASFNAGTSNSFFEKLTKSSMISQQVKHYKEVTMHETLWHLPPFNIFRNTQPHTVIFFLIFPAL